MAKSFGIIGCGAVTQVLYIPLILGLKEFREMPSRFVVDLNVANSKAIAGKLQATVAASIEDLVAKSDIIIIATPPNAHYEVINKCLLPGKTVISEKPFVASYAEAKELVDKAITVNAALYVAHFRRCFPQIQLARSIVQSGVLGKVKEIKIFEGGKFRFETKSGYVFKDKLGGVLLDTGSHSLDSALFAANIDKHELNISVAKVDRNKPEPSHELKASFELNNHESKIKGYIYLSRLKLLSNVITIILEKGFLEFPAGVSNKVKLTGPDGSVMLYTKEPLKKIAEVFPVQYKMMLTDNGDMFTADNFLNLTQLLDRILNFN